MPLCHESNPRESSTQLGAPVGAEHVTVLSVSISPACTGTQQVSTRGRMDECFSLALLLGNMLENSFLK